MFAGDFSDRIKRSRDLGGAERDWSPGLSSAWLMFSRAWMGSRTRTPPVAAPDSKNISFAFFPPFPPQSRRVLRQLEELKGASLFFQLTFGAVEMPHRMAEKPPGKTKNRSLKELQRNREMLWETMQNPSFDISPENKYQNHSKKLQKTPHPKKH